MYKTQAGLEASGAFKNSQLTGTVKKIDDEWALSIEGDFLLYTAPADTDSETVDICFHPKEASLPLLAYKATTATQLDTERSKAGSMWT